MENPLAMLAVDLGASSGRVIQGTLGENRLVLEEVHRFPNDPVKIGNSIHWDTLRLFHEIKQGIIKGVNIGHKHIESVAVDTWGVDFGLLDAQGNLLGNPYHYRDARTDGMVEEVSKRIPEKELYNKTGIQFMKLNTIFQLFAMKSINDPVFKLAKTLLLTPDLFNYFLSGQKRTEYTIASTTQILNAREKKWDKEIIQRLGLPQEIFTQIVDSGTIIGHLTPEISRELNIENMKVIATASHDTQSAIASIPCIQGDFAFLSCGTWSIMGVERDEPVINEKSRAFGFTNEGGANKKIDFMKNIMGLWLLQESRRQWRKEGEAVDFEEMNRVAKKAEPLVSFVDPDHESFVSPGNMPLKIREYCRSTDQKVPENKEEVVRCIIESLAMKYRSTMEALEEILERSIPIIHIVGGGVRNNLLCQLTANATKKRVIAGPVEAAAAGNLIVQAMALKRVESFSQARKIIKESFPVLEYTPQDSADWDSAYKRFREIVELG